MGRDGDEPVVSGILSFWYGSGGDGSGKRGEWERYVRWR